MMIYWQNLTMNTNNDNMQLIAHRGLHSDWVLENSDLAITTAVNSGCTAIEVDLQLTADNQIILFHDFTLQRIFGLEKKVQDITFNQLQILNNKSLIKGRIITLSQALKLIPDNIMLNLELKSCSLIKSYKLTKYVIQELTNTKRINVIISSFNPLILRNCYKLAPSIERAILINRKIPLIKYLIKLSKSNPNFIHCSIALLKEKYFMKLIKLNLPFRVFTVNTIEDYIFCQEKNIEAIFSDKIEMLLNYQT